MVITSDAACCDADDDDDIYADDEDDDDIGERQVIYQDFLFVLTLSHVL